MENVIFQILNRSPHGEEPTPNPSQEGNKKGKGKNEKSKETESSRRQRTRLGQHNTEALGVEPMVWEVVVAVGGSANTRTEEPRTTPQGAVTGVPTSG